MRKIFFLLSLATLSLPFISLAQPNTACNAQFTYSITGTSTVQFTASFPGDLSNTLHTWYFGDNISANGISPLHTYLNAGVYTVMHIVARQTLSGSCIDSTTQVITIGTNACTLTAGFNIIRDSTSPAIKYYFHNTSIGISAHDSVKWTYGDGSSSGGFNGYHTYSQQGTYNVCVRVIKRTASGALSNCISEKCMTVVAAPHPCNLHAGFVFYRDSTNTSLSFHFTNTSVGFQNGDSIKWTFGDGNSSNLANPVHTYTQAGTYTVCLKIIRRTTSGLSNCMSAVCHVVIVQSPPCNLLASFNVVTQPGSPVNSFYFHNTSGGLQTTDSIRWTFGDGTSSSLFNPTHTYLQPGVYNVCLRIQKRNSAGTPSSCVSEICHTVTVPPACNIRPSFTYRIDSVNTRKIFFTNTTPATTASALATWSFGDGTSATGWNTIHEYAHAGTYTVCLRVMLSNTCSRDTCISVVVPPQPVNCQESSNFSFGRITADPLLINFLPNHMNANWQYTWTFGDGTGSQQAVTSHRYNATGNYNACLTVFRGPNCASTTCRNISVLDCSNLQVGYNYRADSPAVNRVRFTAVSNGSIVSQQWTFLKLGTGVSTLPVTINQNNPVFTFADTGYYRVCLKATMSNGCIKEYCQVIYISHVVVTNNCNLQVFPNPATTQINASIQLTTSQVIHLYIYNMLNVQVREKHQQGFVGNNIVNVGIADLPAGIYKVVLIHGNDICTGLFHKF